MIDRNGPVPPYRQVAAILREQVEAGTIVPGDRLPSVSELIRTYGISRTTAVKAVRLLTEAGLAEAVQGWGTYAKRPA
jgi:GntR family transcriptional regulator